MNIAYNMDCISAMKNMKDNAFDLAIVDPVYGDVTKGKYTALNMDGISYHAGGTGKAFQKAYHRAIWQQEKTGPEYFEELFRVSKNQIIWGGNFFTENLPNSQGWIVWDKEKHEGVNFSDGELAFTSFNKRLRIFRYLWDGMLQGDMKNKENRIHPTQKPVALYLWILKNYANKGDKILDTHLGSGSSRIAAYELGFDFVGYEIDKTYFELQEERFKQYTAQQNLFIRESADDEYML